MTWRKWLVRSLVFSVLGGMLLTWLLYQVWTNPVAMRRQVLDKLSARFSGAVVSLDSARMRLLGGIVISDLRMARRDDLERADFLYVPAGIIYHDKEHLLGGPLALRKIELDRPRLRVVRERDGRWNLQNLVSPPNGQERMPTVVIRQGTIILEDRSHPTEGPLLEIHNVNLTAVNDPLPILTVEATGETDVVGSLRINATIRRSTGETSVHFELPSIPVGPTLVQRVASALPDLAPHARQLRGTGSVTGDITYQSDAIRPLSYDFHCGLTGGDFSHARLPLPLEQLKVNFHCVNGTVPDAHLSASAGPTRIELTLRKLLLPASPGASLEDLVQEFDARIEHLSVTPELFTYLPTTCQSIKADFSPVGPVSLSCAFRHKGGNRWHKHWVYHPEGMKGEFCHFRYPFDHVTGSIEMDTDSDLASTVKMDLTGKASGCPVALRGECHSGKAGNSVALDLTGQGLSLDDQVFDALPDKSRKLASQFLSEKSRALGLRAHPLGRADFKVSIVRPRGQQDFSNRFLVTVHDASLKYDLFPYPLENVTATLDIQSDHWACRNLRGTHQGGEIRVSARSFRLPPRPGTPRVLPDLGSARPPVPLPEGPERVQVIIEGRDILLNEEFEAALAPRGLQGRGALQQTWKTLALRGRMSFAAEVIDHPDQPQDIDVGVTIQGCTMQPRFFRYALNQVSARVHYGQGRVYLRDVQGRHGPALFGLRSGVIVLKPTGGFTAWLKDIQGKGLVPDADFLHALPEPLSKGLQPLNLNEPLDVLTDLTLDTDGETNSPFNVWWEGGATLRNASLQAGIGLTGVTGQLSSTGHHDGKQFKGLEGDLLLDNIEVLGQPIRNVHANLTILPESPEVLRFHNLKASLFGGSVGGQALVRFGPTLHYDVFLEALQVRLEEFGRHNLGSDAQLQGPIRASVHLEGDGDDLSGLKGNGRLEVAKGKMYRLPFMLDLLKTIGLRLPDRTAFEQARMIFALDGPKIQIEHLDLYGGAISLRGQGTVNMDGSNLNLDFNADWGRVPQMLPSGLGDLSRAISDQVLKIKVRGKIGPKSGLRFEKELVPGVMDPLKRAFGAGP